MDSFHDRDSGALYDGYVFERCHFDNCHLLAHTVSKRTTIRNVTLRSCTMWMNCSLGPIVAEDVHIEDCVRKGGTGPMGIRGPALKHVTVRGKIAPFNLLYSVDKPDPTYSGSFVRLVPAPEFIDDNIRFYKAVDWALDITEARFEEAGLTGVPGHLVRFDPRSAALVRRERATEQKPRLRELGATLPFVGSIFEMLRGPYESVVLAASLGTPKSRWRQQELDALQRLRDDGIAEPA